MHFGLRLAASFVAAVVAIAATVLLLAFLTQPRAPSLGEIGLVAFMAAIFGFPVFFVVGLPYLAFGYPGLGVERPAFFILGGALLGGLAATGYGMLLVMPFSVPSFFPLGGAVGGATSAAVWHGVARLQRGSSDV